MAVDILSLVVGLVVGGVLVAVAVEVTGRARTPVRETSKLTTGWRLSELREPVLVARDVLDVEVPPGTRVYASGVVDPAVLSSCTVRRVPPVRAEFALDTAQGKALLFLAGVQPGALAVMTVDPAFVSRLDTEWRTLEDRGADYVEQRRISDLPGREGVTVETRGHVEDVLPFRERFMIRLQEGDAVIGVLVDKDPEGLRDCTIQVRGRLTRDRTGYAVIEASDIRRIQ